MHYFIHVTQESPTLTVSDNFDHAIIRIDSGFDYMNCSLSDVIRQHLDEFNRKNIFSPESFTVFEDSFFFCDSMCEGEFFSYSFCCFLYFDSASEVIDFGKTFFPEPHNQYKLLLCLSKVIHAFSLNPSFQISALEIKEIIECCMNNGLFDD